MNPKFNIGQRVYFLISGRLVTEAIVVSASSGFVTIKFRKKEDCIIRLPYNRIFLTKQEADTHIHPIMPYRTKPISQTGQTSHVCTRNWELWE